MKLAICAQEKGLEAEVDQRFGRCAYFVIVDTESGKVIDSVSNGSAEAAGGAGPQAAQLLSGLGVEAVALGNVGPNAVTALQAAKIEVHSGVEGTVSATLQKFLHGNMTPVSGATVSSHAGMNKKK
jgi:predicted Fe-Mo cluster-binding NifX family protein